MKSFYSQTLFYPRIQSLRYLELFVSPLKANAVILCPLQGKFSTPLLLAASGGHKVVVEVLIAHGASASDEDAVSTKPHLVFL